MTYLANDKYQTTLTSGYTASPADTTLSVGSVPSNLPTIVVAAKGTDDETVFSVTGSSGGNTLTGVARLRGANVDLPQGTAIQCLNNEEFVNQYSSAIFNQSGLGDLLYAADGGSTDDYEITLSTAPSALSDLVGVPIAFTPNTINTGACTLDVNGLGATAIKMPGGEDPANGQLPADSIVIVIYDGTNFILQSGDWDSRMTVELAVFGPTSDEETGDSKSVFIVPPELNGFNLVGVAGYNITAGTTGTNDTQLRRVRSGDTDRDMLSTKLTIDSTEKTSVTAETPPVINTTYDDVQTGDEIHVDKDAVQTTKAKGLFVLLTFAKP